MTQKTFKEAQIRDLLKQTLDGEISFSRFVEILNEQVKFRQEVSDEEIEKRYINSYRPIISMEAAIWMRDRMGGKK